MRRCFSFWKNSAKDYFEHLASSRDIPRPLVRQAVKRDTVIDVIKMQEDDAFRKFHDDLDRVGSHRYAAVHDYMAIRKVEG